MTTYTIPQKMSNTGSIHDAASDSRDRVIKFRSDAKYAVVLASYYGGKGYTTHRTERAAIRAAYRHGDYSLDIIDSEGMRYANVDDERLAALGDRIR